MPSRLSPTVRLRRLGAELRRMREAGGLTLDQAGELLERSPSSLSKIENGRVSIKPRDLRIILDGYALSDPEKREALLGVARHGRKKGWWVSYSDLLLPAYKDLIALESDAATFRTFETVLVPGLLQTEDYARAVQWGARLATNHEEIDAFVNIRMSRQRVLTREKQPLQLWAILGEAVLLQQIGGRGVMRLQLEHLLEAAELPNVTLQAMPYMAGAHPGVNGPFVILGFPDYSDLDVVLLENLTSSVYLEREDEIALYGLVFDHLRAHAMSPAESLAMISRLAKDT
ncbi:MAG: helix-turn-helix domain-containing protein [Streptosporangiaceae bacterium]